MNQEEINAIKKALRHRFYMSAGSSIAIAAMLLTFMGIFDGLGIWWLWALVVACFATVYFAYGRYRRAMYTIDSAVAVTQVSSGVAGISPRPPLRGRGHRRRARARDPEATMPSSRRRSSGSSSDSSSSSSSSDDDDYTSPPPLPMDRGQQPPPSYLESFTTAPRRSPNGTVGDEACYPPPPSYEQGLSSADISQPVPGIVTPNYGVLVIRPDGTHEVPAPGTLVATPVGLVVAATSPPPPTAAERPEATRTPEARE